ncbi:MAG TPA: AbrB/MazE/SpoVT family DNA-binding domain-containing protein [Pararhizobium sp.]|uniref:AbrB/MazE/SpoVT family DNA-binding domain-containing protein n=1 Tax=Pararhizobium sp. TaxID=1977563 RepID=UPI002B6C815A|nr:AbrB/MazE/SpoVT family DNA-binding domain-containing protein [Pararhizobium sp.]HTO32730.1 AbrB/MazE/SpoVT family DNA-binding domain-containing protein [Pararhizobium sp.]
MVKLKITTKGQVTLKREVLDHFGAKPGDDIEIVLLPKGEGNIHAIGRKLPIKSLFGMFAYKAKRTHSIDEINDVIEAGWAGEVKY